MSDKQPDDKKKGIARKLWRGCLVHPGCLWSCPCSCSNCAYFDELVESRRLNLVRVPPLEKKSIKSPR